MSPITRQILSTKASIVSGLYAQTSSPKFGFNKLIVSLAVRHVWHVNLKKFFAGKRFTFNEDTMAAVSDYFTK